MKASFFYLLWLMIAAYPVFCAAEEHSPGTPEITSQGFHMGVVQEGLVRKFGRIRVRIEAAEKIRELSIKERSYEIDLARTPDQSHLPLFGLERRVRSKKDVTLDFRNYLNDKIEHEGLYEFLIRVTDEEGQSATAKLLIHATSEKKKEQEAETRLESVNKTRFTLRRIGSGGVLGTRDFGITWKTIGSEKVVIQITKAKGGAQKIAEMNAVVYDEIETKDQLSEKAADARWTERIELPTANDEAAGQVFAVVNNDIPYILKISESETSLSRLGTTVTLNGEYKY